MIVKLFYNGNFTFHLGCNEGIDFSPDDDSRGKYSYSV